MSKRITKWTHLLQPQRKEVELRNLFQGAWFSTSRNRKTTYRAPQKCRQLGTSPDTQHQKLWGWAGECALSESSKSRVEERWLSLGPQAGVKQTQNQVLNSGQYFQRPVGGTLLLKGLSLRHGMLEKEPSRKKAGCWEVKSECVFTLELPDLY